MKSPMQLLLLSLSICALAACTTMDEEEGYGSAADPTPSLTTEDRAYMAQVERMARGRGIEVVWINPPTERSGEDLLAGNNN